MKSRFAPSPTGYLHIGSVRTALFAYLWAKHNNAKFNIRIENTDQQRSNKKFVQSIIDALNWLQIDTDDSIIYQSSRFSRYNDIIDKLLKEGNAYYCNCSQQRLNNLRKIQQKEGKKPKYDGKCREIGIKEGVVRFKNPLTGTTQFVDKIKGKIIVNNNELDDLVIKKSDGTPTYNLAVVVDDHDMKITMVIRGDDHVSNTPRQINLYKSLNWQVPEFAHLPMILGSDGTRLSKRHGATDILAYKEQGFLPQAMINYLSRLGWSYGNKEFLSLAEIITLFSLDAVNKSAARFDYEKLLWLNSQYLKQMSAKQIYYHLRYYLDKFNIKVNDKIFDVINLIKNRNKTLVDMAHNTKMFFSDDITFDVNLANQYLSNKEILQALISKLQKIIWNEENIREVIVTMQNKFNVDFAKIGQPFRVALSGDGNAGDIVKTAKLVGKKTSINRLNKALSY